MEQENPPVGGNNRTRDQWNKRTIEQWNPPVGGNNRTEEQNNLLRYRIDRGLQKKRLSIY
ncbi:MAG: hypothetical protein PHW82_13210 [Bacteroidales bacterium]|nr:hypothetical protein [Bacteroidales bacterium]